MTIISDCVRPEGGEQTRLNFSNLPIRRRLARGAVNVIQAIGADLVVWRP